MISIGEAGIEPMTDPDVVVASVQATELEERIRDLVSGYPPPWQKAYWLRAEARMTYEEIGVELCVNAGTVNKWMNSMLRLACSARLAREEASSRSGAGDRRPTPDRA